MPRTSIESLSLESNNIQPTLPPRAALRGERLPHIIERPVTTLFEEQVGRQPDALAIICQEQWLTFRELNARANQVARHLRELGVGRESLVGICIDRSLEMAVGILGILKAGAAYLPLDPDYPGERVAFMTADARPSVVITTAKVKIEFGSTRTVLLDREWQTIADNSTENLSETPAANDLAYVIYTSGSTGQPKGVMIEHGNLSNYLLALNHELKINPSDCYLHTASIAFSSARRQLLLPLSQGASVVIATSDQRKDPINLFRMIKDRGVTVMDAVPSFWRSCTTILESLSRAARAELLDNSLRLMLSASEPLMADIPRTWMNDFNHSAQHVHMFGQTETAGIVCLFCVPRDCDGDSRVPIGNPIANTEIYILNERSEPCAIGEAGELYLGGAGVGRGYLNRPELTAEKFIGRDGARLYRTGDWARVREDGQIEFAGRLDQQVKLRGFRVELGEIEAAMSQHPGVRECAVVARDGQQPGDKRLLAYYVRRNGAINQNELREFLSDRLPEYSVPSAFRELAALPLSANGKVNRLALPEAESAPSQVSADFVEPRNNLEKRIAKTWGEVLRVAAVGRNDNFYELGGHSLLAAQIVARLRRELRIEVPINLLFEHPTVAELAARVATMSAETVRARTITRFERNGTAPLSFSQQQFWLLDQSSANRCAYNVRTALKITGPLNARKLKQAIDTIIARHEILRTTIVEKNGTILQTIFQTIDVPLELSQLSHLAATEVDAEVERALEQEAKHEFDLSRGPLVRARLLQIAAEEHVLILTLHHIVCDGWSLNVLRQELTTIYHSTAETPARLPELSIQYADFALWQRERLQAETLERELKYWKKQLAGAPVSLELQTDYPRPATRTLAGGRLSATLPRELTQAMRRLSRSENATLFMTLLAAFQALLSRYSGQQDIMTGAPVAGRPALETEDLIGAFVNTVVLRGDVSGNPTFREFLSQVRQTSLAAFAHQDLPFEKLVEELSPERLANQTPLFQVMFAFQNLPELRISSTGVQFTPLKVANEAAKFDLTLEVHEADDGISISFEYAKDLFAPATIERMLGHFQNLLHSIVLNPAQRISDLQLLNEQEQHQLLVQWNSNRLAVPNAACAHELFEAQVERTPDAIAAEFQGQQITYRELNARANQLANYLRKRRVGPEVLVGISVERSLEMLVAILGVLKAGAGYVPLDPNYPQDRLAFMIEDAELPLVLTQQHLANQIPGNTQLLLIDRDWSKISPESKDNPTNRAAANNVAYVIYTSGSTGNPKGVVIEHHSLVNFVFAASHAYDITAVDRMLQFATLSFDLSIEEIFVPLTRGTTVVLRSEDMISSPSDFLRCCEEWKLSILDLPTAYWHELTDALAGEPLEVPASVRLVIIGGEKASPDRVKAWHDSVGDNVRLVNTYGPTETTVVATLSDLKREQNFASGVTPIGHPLSNTSVYVLDSALQPTPIGVAGELYIGGPGVARGYLNRPELTAENFIRDPFSNNPHDRLYKTGDVVRYRVDGELEFIGRVDNQIKIRGFRVEIEEIERAVRSQDAVKDCVVALRENNGARLVAYVVAELNSQLSIPDLRNSLKAKLPSYLIPAQFQLIEALPLMPNGKIDRNGLPETQPQTEPDDDFVAPSTPIEELLASVWCEVLHLDRVGVRDNFFDLGGHSLLAAKVVSQVRNRLGAQIKMIDLFQAPTIATLAERLGPRAAEREARNEFERLMREIAAMTDEEAQSKLNLEFKEAVA